MNVVLLFSFGYRCGVFPKNIDVLLSSNLFSGRNDRIESKGDSDLEPVSLLFICSLIRSIASEIFFLSSLEVSMNEVNSFSSDCSL